MWLDCNVFFKRQYCELFKFCEQVTKRSCRHSWNNFEFISEINSKYPLKGLMLKLKLQYFGHLRQRADSLEKTLMLRKIEGKSRSGQQRMRWLDGITDFNGHELEQTLGHSQGQGNLACKPDWATRSVESGEDYKWRFLKLSKRPEAKYWSSWWSRILFRNYYNRGKGDFSMVEEAYAVIYSQRTRWRGQSMKATMRKQTSRVGGFLLNLYNRILAEGKPGRSYIKGYKLTQKGSSCLCVPSLFYLT